MQLAVSRSIFAHERRLRPRDRPRSSQRPRRYCYRICTCAARRARKDQAAKRPKRFGLSRSQAAGRWKEHAPRAMPPMQSSPQDRRSAASERPSGGPASTAATKFMSASVPTSCRRCRCSPSSCSHHLQLKQPNLALEHRRVDVSFSSGHKAGSGSKRCSPEVIARCVAAGGHSPRDICSTLPARRTDRRRFARSVGHMYLPRSSALRV